MALSAVLFFAPAAWAQSPEEHESHHPAEATGEVSTDSPSSQSEDGPQQMGGGTTGGGGGMMGGGGGGMMGGGGGGGMMGGGGGGMMGGGGMGAPAPRDIYPSLMSLPDLPHEQRHEIEFQAHRRMVEGAERIGSALDELTAGARREDFGAMQNAMPGLREGVAQFDSGLAAHRALAEGRAPRNVALRWFKREMNLVPASSAGLSASSSQRAMHLAVIAILGLFALLMIGMYFLKMRRAAHLLRTLAVTSKAAGSKEASSKAAASKAAGGSDATLKKDDVPKPAERSTESAGHPAETLPALPDPNRPLQSPPDFPVMKSASEPADKWKGRLRVCRIFDEANGVKTFRLAAEHQVALPFTYYPGQFLTIAVPIDGKTARRSYTIASSPTQLHYASITVKREDHGAVSRYLHDEIKVGDTLEVAAPNGKFTFTGEESESIVLIAGGVGVTPMMSAIRYLTDIGWSKDIYLLFSCRTTSDFMFREELEQLQARNPNLNVFASMTRAEGAVWMGLKGRFTREIIQHLVPEVESRRVHVCGPPPMMTAVLDMLTEIGVPKSMVHTEAFGPASRPVRPVVQPIVVGEPPTLEARSDVAAKSDVSRVAFKRSGKEGALREGMTVLDLADEIGVDIDNSCRTGQCGLCKVQLISGHVTMEADDALSDEDKSSNIILACQATAIEPIEVDV